MSAQDNTFIAKLKRIYQSIENLPPTHLTLVLVVLGVLFSILGLLGGTLLISRNENVIYEGGDYNRVETRSSEVSPKEPQSNTSFSGMVVRNDTDATGETEYVLLDESGAVLVFLMADDDKLLLSAGSRVEVMGKIIPSSAGKTLKVEEVIFK